MSDFFKDLEWWKKEWKGMPEFIQEDLTSLYSILVCFENEDDMLQFSKVIKQPITERTRSIWYPLAEIGRTANKRYVDES